MIVSMNISQLDKSSLGENHLCAFASDLDILVGEIPDSLFIETDDGSYMHANLTTVQLSIDNQIEAFVYTNFGDKHNTTIIIFND